MNGSCSSLNTRKYVSPLTTEVNDEETVMKSYHKFLQMLAYIHQTHFRATEKAKIKEKVTSFSKNIFKGMKKEKTKAGTPKG